MAKKRTGTVDRFKELEEGFQKARQRANTLILAYGFKESTS